MADNLIPAYPAFQAMTWATKYGNFTINFAFQKPTRMARQQRLLAALMQAGKPDALRGIARALSASAQND
jgi:hypothetical protein